VAGLEAHQTNLRRRRSATVALENVSAWRKTIEQAACFARRTAAWRFGGPCGRLPLRFATLSPREQEVLDGW
jgi:hypothetical protein